EGRIHVVDSWGFDKPATREAATALTALGLDGRVLLVIERDDVNAALSFRNLPQAQVIQVGELNAYDVLANDHIVFTQPALAAATSKDDLSASEAGDQS